MAPSEPTSCYFVALLGCLDAAIVERLDRWAAESCVEHALSQQKDGSMALFAVKSSARTARQYQSLLRTLTSHWKLPFGKLDRGWLKLLSAEEYRARSAAQQEAEPPVVPARVETHGLPCPAEAAAPVFLSRLSDDFAARSQEALARLRAAC